MGLRSRKHVEFFGKDRECGEHSEGIRISVNITRNLCMDRFVVVVASVQAIVIACSVQ